MSAVPANPFIGPLSFRRGDTLYGRRHETRELLNLLIAERIVLLHSPSGAGKTSLINAALIPALELRDFVVRPPIRVSRATQAQGGNRYVLSTLSCLEEYAGATAMGHEGLAALTLSAYLDQHPVAERQNGEVLIFDQFEEILTLDPTDEAEKLAFFEQLGDALAERGRWALFVMREDYVAALQPWLWPVPTRLNTTYRIGLLGLEAAQQAMRGPARDQGVNFTAEAAAALAQDLARVTVQAPDGRPEVRVGTAVEPVQLQVVCRRLWEQRFGGAGASSGSGDALVAAASPTTSNERPCITVDDVRALGAVDGALADYYDDGAARAARAGAVPERQVRVWFERKLITPQQIRGQVLRGQGHSEGLANTAIQLLVETYLVRKEERRGSVWYELAHDRLIQPVRASNQAWFAANLSALQRTAELWDEQGRPDSLLLRDADLDAAEAWASANEATLADAERAFLAACREERERLARERRQARQIQRLGVAALVAAVVAIIGAGVATLQWRDAVASRNAAITSEHEAQAQQATAEANAAIAQAQQATAEANARIATARQLAASARNRLGVDPELSVLLALQAVAATHPGDQDVPEAADALQFAAQASRVRETRLLSGTTVLAAAYRPDGGQSAAIGGDKVLRLFPGADPAAEPIVLGQDLNDVDYSPDGQALVAGGKDGVVRLFDATGTLITSTAVFSDSISGLRYSPDGKQLAISGQSSRVLILDAATLHISHTLTLSDTATVYYPGFSGDSRLLAAYDSHSRTVFIWSTAHGALVGSLANNNDFGIALNADGTNLVTSKSGIVKIWEVNQLGSAAEAPRPLLQLPGHIGGVLRIAYSRDGTLLATAGSEGQVRLWNLTNQSSALILAGHRGPIRSLRFNHDGHRLQTGGDDGTLRVWDLDLWHVGSVFDVVYSPDGQQIASSGRDGQIKLWDAHSGLFLRAIKLDVTTVVNSMAYSSDGAALVATGQDQVTRIYDAQTGALRLKIPHADSVIVNLVISPDATMLATAGNNDRTARVWSLATGEPLGAPVQHEHPVRTVAFSRDGTLLASGDSSGIVQFSSPRTGSEARPPLSVHDEVTGLAFSPDSRLLAVATPKATARVYRMEDPASFVELHGHESGLNTIVFSPDGQLVATGAADGTARLWRSSDGEPVAVFAAASSVYGVAFSPDGSTLATVGYDGIIRIIPLHLDALRGFALGRVSRVLLSAGECKSYYLTGSQACAP